MKRSIQVENPMTLYFIANNENIQGLEEFKIKSFEICKRWFEIGYFYDMGITVGVD
jgi:hypothetical protein